MYVKFCMVCMRDLVSMRVMYATLRYAMLCYVVYACCIMYVRMLCMLTRLCMCMRMTCQVCVVYVRCVLYVIFDMRVGTVCLYVCGVCA